MNQLTTYYHVPVWLSIIVAKLIEANAAIRLKYREKKDDLYLFTTSYGEESGHEDELVVWNKSPEVVSAHLENLLPRDYRKLVEMVEEYARERGGRDETKVYRGIIQLIVARAVGLFCAGEPDKALVINGDFGLIGRLPQNGKLRINGKVDVIEGCVGTQLEVAHEKEPAIHTRGPHMGTRINGVWIIWKQVPNAVLFG